MTGHATALRLCLMLAMATALAGLTGCPRPDLTAEMPPEEFIKPPDTQQGVEWPLTFADDLGAQITLVGPVQRVVSISPGMTEMIFMLGEGERLVGVTDFCDYPPEAAEIQSIGGMSNPSVEKIVGLGPDLVLAARGVPIDIVKALRESGVTVVGKSPDTLAEVIEDVRDIGGYLGVSETADRAASMLTERMEQAVAAATERLGDDEGPSVLMIIGLEPIFVAGPGSFADDMIAMCGGRNVVTGEAGATVGAWTQYSLEKIVEHDPEIIISAIGSHGEDDALTVLRDAIGWRDLTAVREGRVFDIDADVLLRTGPRMLDGLEAMSEALGGAQAVVESA